MFGISYISFKEPYVKYSYPRCNCDPGSEVWTFDDGQLTDRAQLPVTKLNFGNFYQVTSFEKHMVNKLLMVTFRQEVLTHFIKKVTI